MRYRIFTIFQLMSSFILFAEVGSAIEPSDQDSQQAKSLFVEVIAPAFEQKCLRCHNSSKSRGGLSMESFSELQKGSENGSVIELGKPDESRLLEVLLGEKPEMPLQDEPLKPEVVRALEGWINRGAPWPEGLKLVDKSSKALEKLWSFEPITETKIPELPESHKGWAKNPIDHYIAASQARLQFTPTAETDRRTLIRRIYFDLVGLPPTPEEVHQFVQDPNPDAYDKLVNRLLDSPAYGERWARHWLDIVHYGETHGYDKDKLRPNSWPYRDYVIESLNSDKPYAQFVQEQIAGDVLYAKSPSAIKALGFLAAGPWDFIGHAEVPETKTDGKIARHLDRDDMVGTAVGSLLSLTVQCAQCHDHKFDPIAQADYYSLQAVFAGVDRAERPYFATGQEQERYENLHQSQLQLMRSVQKLDKLIQEQAGNELQKWDDRIASAQKALKEAKPAQFGYHSGIETNPFVEKWVQLNFLESVEITKILLAPCSDDFNQIGDGFGFPPRYKIEISDAADFSRNVTVIKDYTQRDQPNPGIQAQEFEFPDKIQAKYLRLTATKLAPRLNDFILAIAEVAVIDSSGKNIAKNATVSALDSIEAPPRWQKANLIDGISPKPLATLPQSEESPEYLEQQKQEWLSRKVSPELLSQLAKQKDELRSVEVQLNSIPKSGFVFAATVHHGSGAFLGTGPSGGIPRQIFRLNRGDVNQPREEMQPGAIESLKFTDFQLQSSHSDDESARRAALAKWMTHSENPLLWRSIVNRVWQYHFGRGLVDTPGDFGHMGGKPSHPELLDYLAKTFRDGGGKLKSLNYLIATSATYRQQSKGNPVNAEKDSENVYLWRQNRRKLEAEAVRDSILAVAGRLDRTMGGPSFQDFVITHPEHSPHFEYDKADPNNPALHRRSIYRFIVRSQPQPFLTTMDCADPSIRVDKRNESVSAAQALAQWNDALVLSMSNDLGNWTEAQPGSVSKKVSAAFEKCLSRHPTPVELKALVSYSEQFGYSALGRLLMNLNEFSFVD